MLYYRSANPNLWGKMVLFCLKVRRSYVLAANVAGTLKLFSKCFRYPRSSILWFSDASEITEIATSCGGIVIKKDFASVHKITIF